MKTSSPFPSYLIATLCALLATGVIATAQTSPERKAGERPARERQPGGGQPGGFQGQRQGQLMPLMERVLTDEQRESLRGAMQDQREKMREVEEKMRDARRDLLKASMIDKFDESAVRAKALEVGKLDAELTVLRAKAFSQMKPPLTPEQIEQLKNPPPPGGDRRPAGEGRPNNQRRPNRGAPGERDQNDLPPKAN